MVLRMQATQVVLRCVWVGQGQNGRSGNENENVNGH